MQRFDLSGFMGFRTLALSVTAVLAGCVHAAPSAKLSDAAPHHAAVVPAPVAADPKAPAERSKPIPAHASGTSVSTFEVRHALTIKEIPAGSKKARIWFWLPDDDDCQKVLDFEIANAPAGYQITRDPANGHRYLYAEVTDPKSVINIETDFMVRRHAVTNDIDPAKAGPLTEVHRQLFAEYLRTDVPHMEVSERFQKLASEICGKETNVVLQARMIGEWVVDHSDHYSLPNAPKSSGLGDANYCIDNKGGGCTDQHGLFIALARARGIPTRLQFGTLLKPKNEGKEMDPGYRCWVQYFVPKFGWIPMDLSAADTNPDKRRFYLSGLDDHRIRFSEGRNLELSPKQDGPRVNLMIIAYIEVDGKPHKAFDRILKFNEVRTVTADAPATPELASK